MSLVETRIREIKAKRARWGQLHQEPVKLDEVLEIIEHFETTAADRERELKAYERRFRQTIAERDRTHASKVAELNGRIGGLQRKLNQKEG